jgi:hypothetical protein
MGEWFTYLILGQSYDEAYRLTDDEASTAAEGWGGDAYAIYLNEDTDEVIFILDMMWDANTDANEFVDAFTSYADARWHRQISVFPVRPPGREKRVQWF